MNKLERFCFYILPIILLSSCGNSKIKDKKVCYSGIYPHLAYYNNEGECGTGAVVPWADRLWVISYGPHKPFGSSDKLYEIDSDLNIVTRKESVGGTPANRFLHSKTNQLLIGPYVIDEDRNVKVIDPSIMPGRLTGSAAHLTDPDNKVYHGTMEEGFYEVDLNDLSVKTLYTDRNVKIKNDKNIPPYANIPGDHGKGLYSGQNVLIFSNNGELSSKAMTDFDATSGVLAEWDGKDWKVVRRNQFTEITSAGGIKGSKNPETDPIWATGWDNKSLLLGVRDLKNGWNFYRLPKASHSYDGAHGWNTEWPRIRNVGTIEEPDYLMTMHGMFWHFPEKFTANNSFGIRPRSSYLKVIGDFARWKDQIVFGCDDTAQKEFLNKRSQKGNLAGPGQSHSNLWFTSFTKPDSLGPITSEGAIWISEKVKANQSSDPFLFAGWTDRSAWIKNEGNNDVDYIFEVDLKGSNQWSFLKSVKINKGQSKFVSFDREMAGEWIRVICKQNTITTVHFAYSQSFKNKKRTEIFNGIATLDEEKTNAGLLWSLDQNQRKLGILAGEVDNNNFSEIGYYELDEKMNLIKQTNSKAKNHIQNNCKIEKNLITVEESSYLIIDDKNRRWRLPKNSKKCDHLIEKGLTRICREVATERDLFNCGGTFFELPAENADGFAKIRPISSHDFKIFDYTSYRGLLVMTGINEKTDKINDRIIKSEDGKASVWVGNIEDLWNLDKPKGFGGPWLNSNVKSNLPSDPYLIGFYDKKELILSHNSKKSVKFKIEVDPIGHGPWMEYMEIEVKPKEKFKYIFPENFESRWIRFISDTDCQATAWLNYK